MIKKIKKLWNKLIGHKTDIIEGFVKLYKATYLLNSIIKFAIDAALPLGLDAKIIAKIGIYVEKLLKYIGVIANSLNVSLETAFKDEVRSLVTTEAKPLPTTTSKRAKLTMADVVNSYDKAFARLDEILD